MQNSRRKFLSSLALGGLALGSGMSRPCWAQSAGSVALSTQIVGDFSGYPLTLASGVPQSAWSALPGETVHFALAAADRATRALTMHAANGEVVHSFGAVKFGAQDFMTDSPWLDGAGFAPTVSWTIPLHLPSGVYFLNGLPDLFVIAREPLQSRRIAPAAHSLSTAVLIPTNTINAYSTTAGRSAYGTEQRVPELSFLRPFNASIRQNWLRTLSWLHGESLFGVPRHLADSDLDDSRALDGVQLLIVIGHSEYWTRKAREVFDQFVSRGGHVIVASGNAMWWQVRYADKGQRMVCYKDYDPRFGKDPETNPLLVTTGWSSAALKYSITGSIGGDFTHGGYGSKRAGLKVAGQGLRVVSARHPLFAGQALSHCEELDFGGVDEYDGAPIKGLDAQGRPVAAATHGDSRLEIVAYEWTKRRGVTLATAHLFQAQNNGGVIFHLGAPEATNSDSAGSLVMRRAAQEFAHRVVTKESPFSSDPPAELAHSLHTPWPHPLPVIAGRCAPR